MRLLGMEGESVDALVIAPAVTARTATFDDFYRSQYPRLVPLARALCGSGNADDIAQEAMLAAYRSWRTVSELAAPEAWVRRTCANMAVSALRRRMSEVRALVRFGRPADQPPLGPDDEAFWAAVRALPKRQAQAAALRYLYELSVAEIADTLEISQGSVKAHLFRARTALVAELHLDPEHLDPEDGR